MSALKSYGEIQAIACPVEGVRDSVEAIGAGVSYWPGYSPDLNSVETVFSKFQWIIRSTQECTVAVLWDECHAIKSAIFFPNMNAVDTSHNADTATQIMECGVVERRALAYLFEVCVDACR